MVKSKCRVFIDRGLVVYKNSTKSVDWVMMDQQFAHSIKMLTITDSNIVLFIIIYIFASTKNSPGKHSWQCNA